MGVRAETSPLRPDEAGVVYEAVAPQPVSRPRVHAQQRLLHPGQWRHLLVLSLVPFGGHLFKAALSALQPLLALSSTQYVSPEFCL
jgi:hypothetical protein